jgi:O-antigen ligase
MPMPTLLLDASDAPAVRENSGQYFTRSILFLAAFLLIWLTAKPFPDLSDPIQLDPASEGNLLGQVLAVALTLALGAFVYVNNAKLVLKAVTPILVLTFVWFAVSAALSIYPELAVRRLVLAALTIFQAAVFLLLPQDREHFAKLLAVGALIVLTLCYAGVLFYPQLSIHQASDLAEPDLAGNWRGFFTHKNGAGAAMVILVFAGIFIVRTCNGLIGTLIIALASVFLVFTESKTSIRLLPVVLAISAILSRTRSPLACFSLALVIPVVMTIVTIGSVEFGAIHSIVAGLISDPTFTGRDEIWRFALDHIRERPFLGFGYQAFWGTPELLSQWNYLKSWGFRASDAHNAYLNIAVMTGVVGLALSMTWIVVQFLRDRIRTPAAHTDPALTMLFIQIWLFGLCLSGTESELFSGGSSLWFMVVVAIIGMRYQATAEFIRRVR